MSDQSKQNNDMNSVARQIWLVGLGTVASIEEEANKVIENISKTGDELQKKSNEAVESVTRHARELEGKVKSTVEDRVQKVVNTIGYPTEKQVHDLSSRIDKLTQKVEQLHDQLKSK